MGSLISMHDRWNESDTRHNLLRNKEKLGAFGMSATVGAYVERMDKKRYANPMSRSRPPDRVITSLDGPTTTTTKWPRD
jgi:hypothetical protein